MKKNIICFLLLFLTLFSIIACKQKQDLEYKLLVRVQGCGWVEPLADIFKSGSTVTLELFPAEGWQFDSWSGKNSLDVKSFDGEWKLLMDTDKELVAVFSEKEAAKSRTLKIEIEGQGVVCPSGGTYPPGELVILRPEAEAGWLFSHWAGRDGQSVENVAGVWQVLMDTDKELKAVFQPPLKYKLTLTIDGEGRVEVNPPCTSFPPTSTVTLKAWPSQGWLFQAWSGDFQGEIANIQLVMDGDKAIEAHFTPKEYRVSLVTEGQGKIVEILEGPKVNYLHGSTLRLQARADYGWYFAEWSGDVSGKDEYLELLIDSDKEIKASFVKKSYDLTIEIIGQGLVEEYWQASTDYPHGAEVTLVAKAKENWQFKEWRGAYEGHEPEISILMEGPQEIQAVFTEETYCLEVHILGGGQVELVGTNKGFRGEYPFGTLVKLTARAASGWEFERWFGAGGGNTASIEILMDDHKEITAVFVEKELPHYKLDLTVEGEGWVTVFPEKVEYEEGSKISLSTGCARGWLFKSWSGDFQGSEPSISLVMDGPKTLKASFARNEDYCLLEIDISGQGQLMIDYQKSIQASSSHKHYIKRGFKYCLLASADPGWEFSHWEGDIEDDIPILIREIEKDMSIRAVFQKKESYQIDIRVEGQGTLILEPDLEEYEVGSKLVIMIVPEAGWRFLEWVPGGDFEGLGAFIELTIEKDIKERAILIKESID